MRLTLLVCLFLSIWSCKKNTSNNTESELLPDNLPDSAFNITSLTKTDINEFDLAYRVMPKTGDNYTNIYLLWSTSPLFNAVNDSILLSDKVSNELKGKHTITGLKQGASYYARISLRYKNKLYTSSVKEWKVDSLKFTMLFYSNLFPVIAQRGGNVHLRTNAGSDTTKVYSVGSKVTIGLYNCPVTVDKGSVIYFDIPAQIPPGSYSLKLERKGIIISTPDSILILRGFWSDLPTPQIAVNGIVENRNAIMNFGSTQSTTKAYVVGGTKIRPVGYKSFDNELSKELFVLDINKNTWETKPIIAPRNWENPNTFFYNDAIYIVGGIEQTFNAFFNPRQTVRNVWRLDINSMTLSITDTVQYSARYNPVSFQINNEWYIGMGLDSANRSVCCGTPLPAKDFWKYNPSTKQWSKVADFPGTHQIFPTTFTIGSKAYVFIGDIDLPNQELWEYSAEVNSWRRISIPVNNDLIKRGEKYSIVSFDQKIYMFTSQTQFLFLNGYGTTLDNVFIELDPVTGDLRKINPNTNLGIVKPIFQNEKRVIFQSNVLGSIEALPLPNTTNLILD
jgi:hypothetical protein